MALGEPTHYCLYGREPLEKAPETIAKCRGKAGRLEGAKCGRVPAFSGLLFKGFLYSGG